MAAMMDSCSRFIDFGKIDVMPTGKYCVQEREIVKREAWSRHTPYL